MSEPSAEAREAARDAITEYIGLPKIGERLTATLMADSQLEEILARALDAYAAARVAEERERIICYLRETLGANRPGREPTIEEVSGVVEDFTDGKPLGDWLEELRNG